MTTPVRVLIVEDAPDDAELVVLELRRGGYAPSWQRVETAEEMRAALDSGPWDIILSDYSLPQFSALAALQVAKESDPDLPFIVVSGAIGEDVAVEAMRAGGGRLRPQARPGTPGPSPSRGSCGRRPTAGSGGGRSRPSANSRPSSACSEDAIIGKTLEGVITSWNPGAERLYGYAAEEVIGKSDTLLMPPDRADELKGRYRADRQGGAGRELRDGAGTEGRHAGRGVSSRCRRSWTPQAGSSGPRPSPATSRRNGRRKRPCGGRPASCNRCSASMGDGVAGADEQGRFLVFNQAATAILGVGRMDGHPANGRSITASTCRTGSRLIPPTSYR